MKLNEDQNILLDILEESTDLNIKTKAKLDLIEQLNTQWQEKMVTSKSGWIDCFIDFECYNCKTGEEDELFGIQKPYLIVFYNPCSKLPQPHVIKKLSSDHDPVDDFMNLLETEIIIPFKFTQKKFRIIAHNGCKYDFVFLQKPRYILDMKYLGDAQHFKAIIFKDIIYFTDFFLFFSTSLNNLAKEWLGEEKLDHTDFSKITDENWQNYVESEKDYCIQDVMLLKKLWEKFVESLNQIIIFDRRNRETFKYEIGILITISQLSMSVFKQCFLKDNIWPAPEEIQPHIRNSYYGGWTYVNKMRPSLSSVNIGTYIDINSCYPHKMQGQLPSEYVSSQFFSKPIYLDELPQCPKNHVRLVQVYRWRISPFISYSHLPQRHKTGLYYVRNAEFHSGEGWYWEEELAFPDIVVVQIHGYHLFKTSQFANEFVNYFYELKKQAKVDKKPSLESMAKKLMNSLYGKFGEKVYPEVYVGTLQKLIKKANKMGVTEQLPSLKKISGTIWQATIRGSTIQSTNGSRCYIASYVTSQARTLLAKTLRQMPLRFIYCDTDSIFLEGKPPEDILDNYKLGKWKIEACIKSFTALGPKMYKYESLDDKICLHGKGIPTRKLTPLFFDKPLLPEEWVAPNFVTGCIQVLRIEDRILWNNITKIQRPWCEKIQIKGKFGNDLWPNMETALNHYQQRSQYNKSINIDENLLHNQEQEQPANIQFPTRKDKYGRSILIPINLDTYPMFEAVDNAVLLTQIIKVIYWLMKHKILFDIGSNEVEIRAFIRLLLDYYDLPKNFDEKIRYLNDHLVNIITCVKIWTDNTTDLAGESEIWTCETIEDLVQHVKESCKLDNNQLNILNSFIPINLES